MWGGCHLGPRCLFVLKALLWRLPAQLWLLLSCSECNPQLSPLHAEEKPYNCDFCGRQCRTADELRKHFKDLHEVSFVGVFGVVCLVWGWWVALNRAAGDSMGGTQRQKKKRMTVPVRKGRESPGGVGDFVFVDVHVDTQLCRLTCAYGL